MIWRGNVVLIISSPSRAKGQANKGNLKIRVMGDSLTEYQPHPKRIHCGALR